MRGGLRKARKSLRNRRSRRMRGGAFNIGDIVKIKDSTDPKAPDITSFHSTDAVEKGTYFKLVWPPSSEQQTTNVAPHTTHAARVLLQSHDGSPFLTYEANIELATEGIDWFNRQQAAEHDPVLDGINQQVLATYLTHLSGTGTWE
jgi:hypothetical protein